MTDKMPSIDITTTQWKIVHDILQQYVPQCEVWAFGSRVKKTARPYSDLDLAIVQDKALSLDLYAALNEAFSESNLPFKVDLVNWGQTSATFKKIIEEQKVILQKAR